MSYLTLAQARQTLWNYAPGSNGTHVDYASRTAADSLAVDTIINHTIERFLTLGRWRGDTVRARFKVYNNQITLPSTLAGVLGATPIRDVNDDEDGTAILPYSIYTMQHEFLPWAGGNPSSACMFGLVDLGDNFSTFIDPSGEFYIKAFSTTAESSKTILFKGLDEDLAQIYTAGVEGVSLTLTTTPGNTTSQVFTQIASWQKSATTTGVVYVYAVDTTTAENTLILIIPPSKTTSGYHRYRIPDADWGDTVECLCKRAYVPAVADNDLIIPSNIGALKLGMMSLQYEDKNDMDRADSYMKRAIDLLNSDLAHFQGDAVLPSVQFNRNYGAGSIPNIL